MTISIRPLVEADLPVVDRILQAAFDRAHSFEAMLRLNGAAQPGNQLVAVERGQVVGTVGAVNFGRLAYVALMGVDPECHRRGIARMLMESILARLDAESCPSVLLDATDAGAALYEKLGFADDACAFEYEGEPGSSCGTDCALGVPPHPALSRQGRGVSEAGDCQLTLRPMTAADLADVADFDAPRFGACRQKLLHILLAEEAGRAIVTRDVDGQIAGYAFARGVIGPWVARDLAVAEKLFSSVTDFAAADCPARVLVPRSNEAACEMLARRGLKQTRQLRHMRRGGDVPPGQPACLFGQVSFGLG